MILLIIGLLTFTIIILFRLGWGKHNPNAELLEKIEKHKSNGMATLPEQVNMSPLSMRAQKCLNTLNIHYVEDLKKISYGQILGHKGIGPATAEQIVVWALSEHGIHIPGYGGMTTNGERVQEFYV
jgi:NAD-dependent DNA ligase